MNKDEEFKVRTISKFLRTVFQDDINSIALILDAEANILTGEKVKENMEVLINALDSINKLCNKMIDNLKAIKG